MCRERPPKRRTPWKLETAYDRSDPRGNVSQITWADIDRGLLEVGLTPEMIDQMTLSEIMVAQMDPDPSKRYPVMSPKELEAYGVWWQSMTPEEQLWAEA